MFSACVARKQVQGQLAWQLCMVTSCMFARMPACLHTQAHKSASPCMHAAYWDKNLTNGIRAFAAATAKATVPDAGPGPSGLPGFEDLQKCLQLLKTVLAEPSATCSKALAIVMKEQLLQHMLTHLSKFTPSRWADAAAGTSSGTPHAGCLKSLSSSLSSANRLLKLMAALLRSLTASQLAGLPATAGPVLLACTALDISHLEAMISRLLAPLLAAAHVGGSTAVHTQYRTAVLGGTLNVLSALGALALHPALCPSSGGSSGSSSTPAATASAASAVTASVLQAMCSSALAPGWCLLLAHAQPAPAPGQGEAAWVSGAVR